MSETPPSSSSAPDDLVNDEGVLDIDEAAEDVPATFNITSFGADFDVAGLVRRLRSGDIIIPTFQPEVTGPSGVGGFQRDFVWKRRQMDRFIESLLLGLPVPGIFLVNEPDGTLLVLDGSQRLRTLLMFYGGSTGGDYHQLGPNARDYSGLSYSSLDAADRRRLDNSIIHATVIREEDPTGKFSSVYTIFERLNTGGTSLTPQEIRVALYHGPFVRLLSELNLNQSWRRLYGSSSVSLKDQELILRFLAFLYNSDRYEAPMKDFLNTFMAENKNLAPAVQAKFSSSFTKTVAALDEALPTKPFRIGTQINVAVFDSVMVAACHALDAGVDVESLRDGYRTLLDDETYLDAVRRTTANEDRVALRFRLAHQALVGA